MKIQPTLKSLERFRYFAECQDTLRLPPVPFDPQGYLASECFHVHETYGKTLPCREPELLSRALNGKAQHGMTIKMCAEDLLCAVLSAAELATHYPAWVAHEIRSSAARLAKQQIGFVPQYILS